MTTLTEKGASLTVQEPRLLSPLDWEAVRSSTERWINQECEKLGGDSLRIRFRQTEQRVQEIRRMSFVERAIALAVRGEWPVIRSKIQELLTSAPEFIPIRVLDAEWQFCDTHLLDRMSHLYCCGKLLFTQFHPDLTEESISFFPRPKTWNPIIDAYHGAGVKAYLCFTGILEKFSEEQEGHPLGTLLDQLAVCHLQATVHQLLMRMSIRIEALEYYFVFSEAEMANLIRRLPAHPEVRDEMTLDPDLKITLEASLTLLNWFKGQTSNKPATAAAFYQAVGDLAFLLGGESKYPVVRQCYRIAEVYSGEHKLEGLTNAMEAFAKIDSQPKQEEK